MTFDNIYSLTNAWVMIGVHIFSPYLYLPPGLCRREIPLPAAGVGGKFPYLLGGRCGREILGGGGGGGGVGTG